MLPFAYPPPTVPVAVVSLPAGENGRTVSLIARSPVAWLRVTSAASADVSLSVLTPLGQRRQLVRAAPACQVAAARRLCTYRMVGANGRWRITLHKRSQPAAVVRVMLIEQMMNVPPPPR